jgi:predicted dehydrogenase
MPAPIQVGLIGFGFAGQTFHAPIIAATEGLELTAILQRCGDEAAHAYPQAHIVRSLPELLALNIPLIVVATPNDSHASIAKECLGAGREVVIDKPFALTHAEAAEVAELAEKQGRLLSVYQNRRWDGDYQTLQKLATSGDLGRIVTYESHFDRFRPQLRPNAWREQSGPGTGILFDLGPHLIDQALVLFGTPEAVTADVRRERDAAATDDAFDITLHYPSLRAHLRATMLASRPGPHYVVHGTRASYVKFGLDPQEDALKRGERPQNSDDWGREPASAWGTLTIGAIGVDSGRGIPAHPAEERKVPTEPGNYRGYYENIRDAILGRAPLAVTPTAALRTMRIIQLAEKSSAERRTVTFTP